MGTRLFPNVSGRPRLSGRVGEWWTVFVENYGGAFMYGKFPNNTSEADKAALPDVLERMVSGAVAAAPGAERYRHRQRGNA
jgi:hypothetical protein